MKQLLILSGKGGTGKTTIAAAFIRLAEARAFADCDVDAPNLHFVVRPQANAQTTPFYGLDIARIDPGLCMDCGVCAAHCRFGAIDRMGKAYAVDPPSCEGCGVCVAVCEAGAVSLVPDAAGELLLSRTAESVFSTARLKMGKGNSGLLVTEVKKRLREAALPQTPLAIIDGSPGIGCPVIASLSGVDMVLLVAEPSLSGISDMQRIVETARRFDVLLAVCVNKYDVSPEHTTAIETFCQRNGLPLVGSIPYDPAVLVANNAGQSIVDVECPSRLAVKKIFTATMALLAEAGGGAAPQTSLTPLFSGHSA